MVQNQRMYWGVNFGQWPAFVVDKLVRQGRHPPTFNIIAKKIESQIGSYFSNGFDIKYETRNGRDSHWSLDLVGMMYHDKSDGNWDATERVALRDFHVMVGYERMFISDKHDADFGNISWEAIPSTHVFPDIEWRSVLAGDIENYFEYGDYSVAKIMKTFPNTSERLKDLREREERDGIDYGEYMGGPQRYITSEEKWENFHKVITFHYVTREERQWEYDLVNRNAFPETGYDAGSKEDIDIKREYVQRMGLTGDDITTVRQVRKVKRIEAVCPTLDNELFLIAGKDRIQTNNCNLYPLGNAFNGQFRGMADDMYDIQISFNKGRMMIEDIIQRSAKGSYAMDLALTGGREDLRADIEARMNIPGAKFWVDEGVTAELGPHGGIIELPGHQVTPDMFRHSQENMDLADRLSTMPSAMESRTESTAESGKLFNSKIQVALVSQKYGMMIWEQHKKEKAAAYPLQAKITYAGYPREFRKHSQGENLVINQLGIDTQGRKVVIKDISVLPEMNVILTASPMGSNLRTELRSQYAESLPLVEKDPKDRLVKLILLKNVYSTQDMSEEDRMELMKAFDMLIQIEAMGNALVFSQVSQQLNQVMNPQSPQEPQQTATIGGFDKQKAITGTPQEAEFTPVEKGAANG
jgi:hypothetical protein